jgi:two-component system CheB/CheR fusion protein
LIAGVIDSVTPYESEVKDRSGRSYALRIRPYVTTESKIDGASIVLIDTDSLGRLTPALPPPQPSQAEDRS